MRHFGLLGGLAKTDEAVDGDECNEGFCGSIELCRQSPGPTRLRHPQPGMSASALFTIELNSAGLEG